MILTIRGTCSQVWQVWQVLLGVQVQWDFTVYVLEPTKTYKEYNITHIKGQ